MAAGIECYDSAGNLIFGTSSGLIKFLGYLLVGASYTGTAQTGYVDVPEFTSYTAHTPFFEISTGAFSTEGWDVEAAISGNRLTWTYPQATVKYSGSVIINRPDTTIIYGIY